MSDQEYRWLNNHLIAGGTRTMDLVVEIVSIVGRYFCYRSYLCCDKILVSIATIFPVSVHTVRQKAWSTCFTSS